MKWILLIFINRDKIWYGNCFDVIYCYIVVFYMEIYINWSIIWYWLSLMFKFIFKKDGSVLFLICKCVYEYFGFCLV